MDCQPYLIFTGNRVTNNRAHSLLCSTAGKIRIANNCFEHPVGENIKVLGDASFWFESGAVRDVTIENNVFLSRSPSAYVLEFGPEEKRLKESGNPFHSNIRVLNNEFYLSSPKLIQAPRVDGFEFRGNMIRASKRHTKGRPRKSHGCQKLQCCRDRGQYD